MVKLLKTLKNTKHGDLDGSLLLSSTAIVYYSKEDLAHTEDLSSHCDARIIWGGKEAIETISNTPKKENCEDIIFGPKYSFAIIDKGIVNDKALLKKNMEKLAYDILFSEQDSCTSPQVLICEAKYSDLNKIALELKNSFDNLPEKFKKREITMFDASNIIRIRSEYAIEDSKDLIISKSGNDWTILMDKDFKLEDPIRSRTIFIKSCDNLDDVGNLITSKIQTIGYAFKNKDNLLKLGKDLNLRGVSRIVPLGQMNYHDAPWDGKLLISRLVNINSLKLSGDEK
jgi:hypothetical protein